jgi:AraC-like DNA-binding protein
LIFYHLYAVNISQPKKSNIFLRPLTIIAAVLLGLVTILVLETHFIIRGKFYPGFVFLFFSPIPVIFLSNLISIEIRSRQAELDSLYNKMKIPENGEKHKGISDTTEKKLEIIMKFMDENFRSALSKEGLAAAVDMHPNYMGTQFKTYTGKAIHEYINHRRIEEAIRQLESGNLKIVDIAFSVGFESMSSFNRIFKNVTGKTPSEYKMNLI